MKRIEIQGFKSFADPISIEFKEGVTCIIGPNGSGKSNISDAMRWVLGEQSARALRGGKMEEIIFAGTDSRRPKGMAEVTLLFDNSAGVLDIDYSEVAIRRRLFRSGESEYFINGNPCRLRDIRELIMDTGIGVDGYSFIGQGRVDKIVSDRPDSRREVFEEAAGIIKYKSKRAEAERKLESAGGNLDRVNDIIADIESRIDGLSDESAKAKEHAEISKRYRSLEINITLKNIENLQGRQRELTAQFEEADGRLGALRREKAGTEANLSALRERDAALEERGNELRERINANSTRAMGLDSDARLSEERRKSAEKDRARLSDEVSELTRRIEADQASIEKLAADRHTTEEILDGLGEELAGLLAAAAEKESRHAGKVGRIDELRAELFELSRDRSRKEAELSSGESLFGNFDETESGITTELSAAETESAALKDKVEGLRAAAAALSAETAELDQSTADTRARYNRTISAVADKRVAIETLQLQAEKQSSRRRTIAEMESNYEGYNTGVKALMKSGQTGIHGVVAELLKADPGFETAIETALGATLQNIVCEADADAKAAIRFLKENQAGRLTFLPVQTIRPRETGPADEMEASRGFEGYATDRIDFDSRFESVFEYLLGRTVVAETLDDAIAMSKKNRHGYRIVTKDGEIISPAGALTGGSFRHKTANLLERRNEIEALGREIEALAEKCARTKSELDAILDEGERLLAQIHDSETALREKDADRIRTESELKTAELRISEMDARLDKRKAELVGIEKDRENSSGMMEQLRAEIASLSGKMDALSSETERETEGLAEAKEDVDRASEAATEVRLRVAEANRDKENAAQLFEKAQQSAAESRSQLAAKERELAALESSFTNSAGTDTAQELSVLAEEKQKLDAALETAMEERRGVRRRIEETESATESAAARIEAQIASKNGMEVELGRQDTRLTTWKEKLFEEFELSYVHALEYRDPDFIMGTGLKENRAIKDRLREIGEVNPGSIREYEETNERYTFLSAQRDDLLASIKDFRDIVQDMDKISREKFRECFDTVSEAFSETFVLLFGGGKGEIRLEDANDPLECGIDIKISPPGKTNLASIDSYSGGEKSMIAIALLFSILRAKPTPFCILDEIDAALDESNIHRFANYVSGLRGTQFALVTHQRSTMEYADALFGVTMQEQGVTSVLSLMLGARETEEFADALNFASQ